jgi:hypothetical protein
MACALVAIGSATDCVPNEGGIFESYATNLSSITSATITANVISNFTMSATGLWKKFTYDKDNTANYNQVGSLNGNRFSVEQTAFMKFRGISQAYIAASNTASECCNTVWVHFLSNGVAVVQGFEYLSATGTPIGTKNRDTRIVPSMNTDTSQNEARTEWTVSGNSNTFGNTTSLTGAALLAL